MTYPDRESYTFFQVDRPILGGAEEFLVRAAEIGNKVIGLSSATSLSETILEEDEFMGGGELKTQLRTLQHSRTEIFRPGELRMILLRRIVPSEFNSTFNFSAKAAAYHTKRQSHIKRVNGSKRNPNRSVVEQIDDIATLYDQNPKDTGVYCDRIQQIDDPIFGSAMALVPNSGQSSSFVLGKQASKALDTATTISPRRLAYSSNPWTPMVPFMTLPADLESANYSLFCDRINELLTSPVRLVMGAVEAYSASATGDIN